MVVKKWKKQKEKNPRTHPNRIEIFRWLLRNGINKMDIDRVKTKVLM